MTVLPSHDVPESWHAPSATNSVDIHRVNNKQSDDQEPSFFPQKRQSYLNSDTPRPRPYDHTYMSRAEHVRNLLHRACMYMYAYCMHYQLSCTVCVAAEVLNAYNLLIFINQSECDRSLLAS